MILHRIIRIVCLVGSGIAPVISAYFCRFISQMAVKHVIPKSGSEELPAVTQVWAVGVADGKLPLVLIAFSISFLIILSGLYAVISKRPSADTRLNALVIICCAGFAIALISVCSTLLAIILPFLQTAIEL